MFAAKSPQMATDRLPRFLTEKPIHQTRCQSKVVCERSRCDAVSKTGAKNLLYTCQPQRRDVFDRVGFCSPHFTYELNEEPAHDEVLGSITLLEFCGDAPGNSGHTS
jgi:hypothetical protein